ncbi:methyltransferase domain-containing protein [Galbibacter mesophilus]|uniref:methyltransferase domain-containing protein n=1 Tax=Galbibacter mesophilus TaxID=379069 RepID=UPI00191E26FE|nr:methyltransferase domain-containing protein [Galbibacter mesophilus]MCM5663266.1 methyltransferase domain-containing protein [Galbibacter mesophilus]
MIFHFPNRCEDTELMDDPNLNPAMLEEVLKDLATVNKLLNGNKITIKAIEKIIRDNPNEHFTILDMGCGDGQLLRDISVYFRKKRRNFALVGIDISEKGIEIAKERSKEYPEISFHCQDILNLTTNALECDILVCSLTMHHFKDHEIPLFLEKFVHLAKIAVIINDLERSKLAYYLFKFFSAIFIKTKIAKEDGLVSIKSGFTKDDLHHFSNNLPQISHSIQWKWAFRYLWVLQKAKSK